MLRSLVGSEMCIRDSSDAAAGAISFTANFQLPTVDSLRSRIGGLIDSLGELDIAITIPDLTNIVDRVRSFAEAIIGFFRRIFEEVIGGSYWTDTVDGVVSFSRDLIGLALPFIEDFRENVVAIFEAISTVVGNVIDNIREAFAAAGQDVTVGNVEQADQGNAFIGVAALGASIAGAFALESTRTAIGNAFSAGLSFLQPVALLLQ